MHKRIVVSVSFVCYGQACGGGRGMSIDNRLAILIGFDIDVIAILIGFDIDVIAILINFDSDVIAIKLLGSRL